MNQEEAELDRQISGLGKFDAKLQSVTRLLHKWIDYSECADAIRHDRKFDELATSTPRSVVTQRGSLAVDASFQFFDVRSYNKYD